MKSFVRATALIVTLITTPAAAADLYGRGPAFAAAPFNGYNWNGVYIGANLGYRWGSSPTGAAARRAASRAADRSATTGKFIRTGCWHRSRHSGLRRRRHLRGLQVRQSVVRHAARPRRLRHEQRAGLSHRRSRLRRRPHRVRGDERIADALRLDVGGGVEVGLTPNWSAKAEYLYVRLEDRSYVLTGVNNGFSSNVFRLGVNYRF